MNTDNLVNMQCIEAAVLDCVSCRKSFTTTCLPLVMSCLWLWAATNKLIGLSPFFVHSAIKYLGRLNSWQALSVQ